MRHLITPEMATSPYQEVDCGDCKTRTEAEDRALSASRELNGSTVRFKWDGKEYKATCSVAEITRHNDGWVRHGDLPRSYKH